MFVLHNNKIQFCYDFLLVLYEIISTYVSQREHFSNFIHQCLDLCTGYDKGTVLLNPMDSTNKTYYNCSMCGTGPLLNCAGGKTFDERCKKCVTTTYPDCDSTGKRISFRSQNIIMLCFQMKYFCLPQMSIS